MTTAYLIVAIVFEAGWAIAMKLSDGFRKPAPAAVMAISYILSALFLALATRRMEVGIAYAIWAGAGAALIATAGILWFNEPATAAKLISLTLIIAGIAGLRLYH